LRISVG